MGVVRVCVRGRVVSKVASGARRCCTYGQLSLTTHAHTAPHQKKHTRSVVEMLFCTSLLAYVGAGEQPALTPRRLGVLNTSTGGGIQDLHFAASVLAVRLNRER